jgi:peptidoglycan/xylan/chitin deacetylase (PgdA/CDA1 family)
MRTRTRLWFDSVAERDGESAVEAWKSRSYDEWRAGCVCSSPLAEDDPRALMTPAELAELANAREIEIGGHTVNHPILARAPESIQRQEIEGNLQAIEEWTGRAPRTFAYPNGRPGIDYTGETMRVLRDCGIDMAFSTTPAFSRLQEPSLERSRFLLLDETTDAELAHRLRYSWPR